MAYGYAPNRIACRQRSRRLRHAPRPPPVMMPAAATHRRRKPASLCPDARRRKARMPWYSGRSMVPPAVNAAPATGRPRTLPETTQTHQVAFITANAAAASATPHTRGNAPVMIRRPRSVITICRHHATCRAITARFAPPLRHRRCPVHKCMMITFVTVRQYRHRLPAIALLSITRFPPPPHHI